MRTVRLTHAIGITAALATITVTAACGSGSSNNSTSATGAPTSSTGAPTTGSSNSNTNAGTLAGVKVGMVGLYNLPYITNTSAGSKMAAEEYGAEYTQYGPQGLDPNKAIADFQNAVAAGNKGMLVFAYPGDLWKKPIDTAVDQGVVVSTTDDYSENSKAITETGAPKVAMGAAIADEFIKRIPEGSTGTIVPGICVPGLQVLTATYDGFKIRMNEKRPGVQLVEPEATSGDPAQDFAAWQRIISKYPDALGFLGLCDIDLTSLAQIAMKTPDAKWMFGSTVGGDDAAALDQLTAKNFVAAIEQRAWLQGYVGMKYILNNLAYGTAMPDGWVNTGYDVVTSENIDAIKATVTDPEAAKAMFINLANKLVAEGSQIAIKPMTYEYDPASVNEPNPAP